MLSYKLMIIQRILVGLLLIGIGTVSLKYSNQIVDMFGHLPSLERKLGAGSSYAVIKFLSVLIVLFGCLYLTNTHGPVLRFIFAPLQDIFRLN
jgi:hypothetical protein